MIHVDCRSVHASEQGPGCKKMSSESDFFVFTFKCKTSKMFPQNQMNQFQQFMRQNQQLSNSQLTQLQDENKRLETKLDLYKTLLSKTEKSLEEQRTQNLRLVNSNRDLETQSFDQIKNLRHEHEREISGIKRKYYNETSELKNTKSKYSDKCIDLSSVNQKLRESFREKERQYERDIESKDNMIFACKTELNNCKNIMLELLQSITAHDASEVVQPSISSSSENEVLQSIPESSSVHSQSLTPILTEETNQLQDDCTLFRTYANFFENKNTAREASGEGPFESPMRDAADVETADILNEILLHVEKSGYTYNQICATDLDMLNSSQRVTLDISKDFYDIIEEDVSGKLEESEKKYFYTITVNSDTKLVTMVETFRWFTEQSSKNYSLLNTASNKQLSSTGKCIDILKLRTQLGNDKKRPRLCLTGRGVIAMCKEIIKATGDTFKTQINDVLLVVPTLTWSLCEQLI